MAAKGCVPRREPARARQALDRHRRRASRRPLTEWTNCNGAQAVLEPLTRTGAIEGMRLRYLDALRAHEADGHHRAAVEALRQLAKSCTTEPREVFAPIGNGMGRWTPMSDLQRATVEGMLAELESQRPYLPIGETRRIGVDAAFVADVSDRADDDMIAEAMWPDELARDPGARERLVQRVKDLRRR